MPGITIELTEAQHVALSELAARCTEIDRQRHGGTTHGAHTVDSLVAMIVEDLVLVERRPGCWEAEKINDLLSSHGYDL